MYVLMCVQGRVMGAVSVLLAGKVGVQSKIHGTGCVQMLVATQPARAVTSVLCAGCVATRVGSVPVGTQTETGA